MAAPGTDEDFIDRLNYQEESVVCFSNVKLFLSAATTSA